MGETLTYAPVNDDGASYSFARWKPPTTADRGVYLNQACAWIISTLRSLSEIGRSQDRRREFGVRAQDVWYTSFPDLPMTLLQATRELEERGFISIGGGGGLVMLTPRAYIWYAVYCATDEVKLKREVLHDPLLASLPSGVIREELKKLVADVFLEDLHATAAYTIAHPVLWDVAGGWSPLMRGTLKKGDRVLVELELAQSSLILREPGDPDYDPGCPVRVVVGEHLFDVRMDKVHEMPGEG